MMAAVLRQFQVEVRFFLLYAHQDNSADLCRQIVEFSPDLISLALYDYNNLGVYFEDFAVVDAYAPLCKQLKASLPNLHINAASWFVTYCAEDYLQEHPEIDSVIIGESELTVVDLLGKVLESKSLENCPGISFRRGSEILITPTRPAVINLDELPFMARDMYHNGPARIATSRGCHAACEFCSIAYFHPFNSASRWRGRSPENIVAEIKYLIETYHVDTIEFEDGSFEDQDHLHYGDQFERMLKICDLIIESNLKILFAVFMRTATALQLSDEAWAKLRKAGLYKIFVGVDSVDGNIRKLYRKPNFDIRLVPALREKLHNYHIEMRIGYIMFDPWVDIERLENSLDFLKTTHHLCWAQCWTPLELLPGLPVIEKVRQDGLLSDDYRYDRPWSYNFRDPRIKPLALAIKNVMRAEPKQLDTALKLADIMLHRRRRFVDTTEEAHLQSQLLSDSLEAYRRDIAVRNELFLRNSFNLAKTGWSQSKFGQLIETHYAQAYVARLTQELTALRKEISAEVLV